MSKQVLQILWVFGLFILFTHCAQIVPLSGGKRDTTPPKLLEAAPQNKNTGFNSDYITLKFDEFVQIKDLPNQMVVSPKIKTPPVVNADGKRIIISLKKEELAPNTTYRLFLGKAIADMNESNSISGFEYIFSTGNHIDSLKLNGNITDAFNNRPVSNVLVGLYRGINNDSLPYKENPDYTAQSNESGDFYFSHLPYGTFNIYAFTDKNRNQVYDGETEKIAFLGSELKLGSDSLIKLTAFQEEPSKTFIKKVQNPYYGLIWVILNKKSITRTIPSDLKDKANIYEPNPGKEKDTISIYYRNIQDTLKLNVDLKKSIDTLTIALPRYNAAKKRFRPVNHNMMAGILPAKEKIRIVFTTWMDTLRTDPSKIKIKSKEDSLVVNRIPAGKWRSLTEYEIDAQLKEGVDYTFKADTNSFYDVMGMSNDSIFIKFKTQSVLDLGNVKLKMKFRKKQQYIVQLINELSQVAGERIISFSLSSSNAETIDFTGILPGTYSVKIIFDDNKNNKWDTGRLISKQQPEKVVIHSKQIKVLSDWEVEEEISVKE
jgi:hypothetical protein